MTAEQQVCAHIINMSDVSKRIGVGKGIIEEPTDFDKWNEEIADLFEDMKNELSTDRRNYPEPQPRQESHL